MKIKVEILTGSSGRAQTVEQDINNPYVIKTIQRALKLDSEHRLAEFSDEDRELAVSAINEVKTYAKKLLNISEDETCYWKVSVCEAKN